MSVKTIEQVAGRKKRKSRSFVIDSMLRAVREQLAHERQAIADEYYGFYATNPEATPRERFQVDILILSEFESKCLRRVENMIYTEEIANAKNPETALGEAWINRSEDFMRITRRASATEKTYRNAMLELERLRAGRGGNRHAPKAPKAASPKPKPHNLVEMPTAGTWVN